MIIVVLGALADTWLSVMPLADTPKPFRALACGGETASPLVELPLGDRMTTSRRCTVRCRTTVPSSTATADIFRRTIRRCDSA